MTLLTFELPTLEHTQTLGRALGGLLRAGDLVILSGELGAGKTALTKAIAVGMGISATVTSPTFVLARVYSAQIALVHVDAYRLADGWELDDLDLDTELTRAAVVVEWGEGKAEQLADSHLLVRLTRMADDSRMAQFQPHGTAWEQRLAALRIQTNLS